jgi:hypothetical protein
MGAARGSAEVVAAVTGAIGVEANGVEDGGVTTGVALGSVVSGSALEIETVGSVASELVAVAVSAAAEPEPRPPWKRTLPDSEPARRRASPKLPKQRGQSTAHRAARSERAKSKARWS